MYENLLKIYEKLKINEVKALNDFLHILDIFTNGSLSKLNDSNIFEELEKKQFIEKRKQNMPFEYIFEKCVFMDNVFKCTSSTLIPRKDTEFLVEKALELIENKNHDHITVFDIGTGTGNIAISIALRNENVKIFASDISIEALNIARLNVDQYRLSNRIKLLEGDMFEPFKDMGLDGKADLIICNPPYIPVSKVKKLSREITDHEPIQALAAGSFGLDIFTKLIEFSPLFLKNNSSLIFEFGVGQDGLINRFFKKNSNYSDIKFYEYNDEKRVVSATCIY